MSLHIQFNSIVRKEPNKQSKQGKQRVHFAEDDERPPNGLTLHRHPQSARQLLSNHSGTLSDL